MIERCVEDLKRFTVGKLGQFLDLLPHLTQQCRRAATIDRHAFMKDTRRIPKRRPLTSIPELTSKRKKLDPRDAPHGPTIQMIEDHE